MVSERLSTTSSSPSVRSWAFTLCLLGFTLLILRLRVEEYLATLLTKPLCCPPPTSRLLIWIHAVPNLTHAIAWTGWILLAGYAPDALGRPARWRIVLAGLGAAIGLVALVEVAGLQTGLDPPDDPLEFAKLLLWLGALVPALLLPLPFAWHWLAAVRTYLRERRRTDWISEFWGAALVAPPVIATVWLCGLDSLRRSEPAPWPFPLLVPASLAALLTLSALVPLAIVTARALSFESREDEESLEEGFPSSCSSFAACSAPPRSRVDPCKSSCSASATPSRRSTTRPVWPSRPTASGS